MPTIKDLIRAELDRGKSLRDLEVDSGGRVRFQTFQDLSNHPPKQFPKQVETIAGMAQALHVDQTTIVLAYAKGLGIEVGAGSLFALRLPPGVDALEPQMQNALIAVTRAALGQPSPAWDKTIRDREVRLMEQLGPDVYFHVLGRPDRPTQRRKRPPTVVEGRFSQSDLKRSLAAG